MGAVSLAMMAEADSLPIALRRGKRTRIPVNYREADMVKLPRVSRSQDKTYPITILEQDSDKVKVHYTVKTKV